MITPLVGAVREGHSATGRIKTLTVIFNKYLCNGCAVIMILLYCSCLIITIHDHTHTPLAVLKPHNQQNSRRLIHSL